MTRPRKLRPVDMKAAAKTLRAIAKALEPRADIYIASKTDTRITGHQLRRIWEVKVLNPESFTPYEQKGWFYVGESFTIETAVSPDGLNEAQETERYAIELCGGLYVAALKLDDALGILGPKTPDWIDEYQNGVGQI